MILLKHLLNNKSYNYIIMYSMTTHYFIFYEKHLFHNCNDNKINKNIKNNNEKLEINIVPIGNILTYV